MAKEELITTLKLTSTMLRNASTEPNPKKAWPLSEILKQASRMSQELTVFAGLLEEHREATPSLKSTPATEQLPDPLCNHRDAAGVMTRAYAMCPSDLTHLDKMRWIADYYEVNRKASFTQIDQDAGKQLFLSACAAREIDAVRAELDWQNWQAGYMTQEEWQRTAETFLRKATGQTDVQIDAETDTPHHPFVERC